MTKLRMVRLYKAEDVPDYLLQQVTDLINKMCEMLVPCFKDQDPNVVLSAFNRVHAGMIMTLVEKSDLLEAVKTEAIGLVKNVEHMSGQKIFEGNE